jgi:hypothetical protein
VALVYLPMLGVAGQLILRTAHSVDPAHRSVPEVMVEEDLERVGWARGPDGRRRRGPVSSVVGGARDRSGPCDLLSHVDRRSTPTGGEADQPR